VKAGVAYEKPGEQGAEPCNRIAKSRSKIDHSLSGERHERFSGRKKVRFFVVHFRSAYRFDPQSRTAKPSGKATVSSHFSMKVEERSPEKPESDLLSAAVSSSQRRVMSDVPIE
jgi:hypothetical protein